jgi:FkbM family methyltransferase
MISYTRNFEDVMIGRALKHIENGFYADIGAFQPVLDSNTYALYERGWRGIAIEPQTIFNELWQQHRPEDGLLNAAVGASDGETTLHRPKESNQAATIHTSIAQQYQSQGLNLVSETVAMVSLNSVLTQLRPEGDIHLLSIDVEGAEYDVLLGLDLQRFRPWLLVIESTLPGMTVTNYEHWEPLLLNAGYDFVYFDAVNRFYVAKEHAELKAHFTLPPNVWDDFVGFELMQAKRELELTYSHLGGAFVGTGQHEDALAAYRRATELFPNSADGFNNVGMLLRWKKNWIESENHFRRALELNPNKSDFKINLSALLLAQGRFEEGWALFEARYLVPEGEKPRMSHNAPYVRWTGESLTGKSIMVMREQGYGDEIMFARFVQTLKARGAAKVSLLCQPAIESLMRTVIGIDEVYCDAYLREWPPHDFWIYNQSLPHALGVRLESIPAPIPYLVAAPPEREKWRQRLATQTKSSTFKVGINWKGSPQHGNDKHRSLAGLHILQMLWAVEGVSFISLQTGDAAFEAKRVQADQPLLELGSELVDFADGAALVSELDLVISVDTAMAHLAGALGVPCFVMIPLIETDWRWLTERDDSPWYPNRMKVFRQTMDMVWDDVVQAMRIDLEQLVQQRVM